VKIRIIDPYIGQLHLTADEWADEAATKFNMAQRVPGIPGEAFDLKDWYNMWRNKNGISDSAQPTHLRVTAVDEFTAIIPWGQLDQAAFQFAIDGERLTKGYPIRLYVPNGSSDCLHVKSVVQVELLYDPELGEEASFGFINHIKLDAMTISKGV
jgi:hypothetical protein